MAVSQNNWSVIDSSQLDKSPIPGTNVVPVPGLRHGSVAKVLLHVGKLFNETVAPVYNPGCWGWNAPVPIPGSNIISNHASGTAIDLNAPSFPWQQVRMSPGQREACRKIVWQMEGLVAWGGDFTTKVDEMHFEINGTEAEIDALAKKIDGDNMSASESKVDLKTVQLAYNIGLFRQPTDQEVKGWMDSGHSVEQLMRTILDSKEHDNIGKSANSQTAKAPTSDADKKLAEIKAIVNR